MSDDYDLFIGSLAEAQLGFQVGQGAIRTHSINKCAPYPCVLHNPSDHHMRDWPTNYRADRWLMERICPHWIGHPDPDDLAFHHREGRDYQGVHGCDGCCAPPKETHD